MAYSTVRRLGLISLLLAACGDASTGHDETASTAQGVVFGSESGGDDDGVVLLDLGSSHALCSGVLVHSRVVLTARHCLSHVGEGLFTCREDGALAFRSDQGGTFLTDRPPSEVRVFTGSQKPSIDQPPSAIGKAIVHDDAPFICGHDIAALILDRPMAARKFDIRSQPVAPHEPLRLVGWGFDESGTRASSRRSRGNIPVSRLGPAPAAEPHHATITANEFDFGEGACDGDSGGAVLDVSGALVGIVSRGDGAARELGGAHCFGPDAQTVASSIAVHEARIRGWIAPVHAEAGRAGDGGCSTGGSMRRPNVSWYGVLMLLCCILARRRT